MTYDEALNGVIEGITNLEDYDEHLSVLRSAAETMARAEADENWEEKYNKLSELYRKRFSERAGGDEAPPKDEEPEEKEIKFDDIDLDFDGRTE